jgi:alpha-tubulin suppressor-like RCC1 family protein
MALYTGGANLALKSDGTVVGWGNNGYGDGRITPPAGLGGVVGIAAGEAHSLALKSDGTVVGWGYNGDGEATPPAGLGRVVRIAAGGYHSLALKNDGTVVGWGGKRHRRRG